tara:strand:+ start:43 stop:357 length:315 start_codon:yes stop_codon:yes gene_type:complete
MNYDNTWTVMNDVEEAFSQITTIEFLTNQIQRAVDVGDINTINDAAHALIAFVPTYAKNFDEKFATAWGEVVTPLHQNVKKDEITGLEYSEVVKYYNTDRRGSS